MIWKLWEALTGGLQGRYDAIFWLLFRLVWELK